MVASEKVASAKGGVVEEGGDGEGKGDEDGVAELSRYPRCRRRREKGWRMLERTGWTRMVEVLRCKMAISANIEK